LTRNVMAAGVLAAFVAFPIPGVFAQSSAMNDNGSANGSAASAPAPGAQAQAAQVDDATLQKAAKAYVKVKQIVKQTKQAAPASNGAQPDQSAAQSEKIAAVKNEGLDPQQYDQVIQMVQNDPGLQQKFVTYVNQNGGDSE
ncbi:MAG TPA: DUF4168 domain-containing protein, partial [Candidatus Limnocylindrales bacterium]|nr:DUF4168 domain-containing protein [Candidatus Limnocylindrales bacterium]